MKILIVDDSDPFRKSICKLIRMLNNEATTYEAQNVSEAIRMAKEVSPDAILLDISLPDGLGFEVIETLKKQLSPPIIIILTNYSSKQFRDKAQQKGADYFFDKSDEFEAVIDLLQMKKDIKLRTKRNPII